MLSNIPRKRENTKEVLGAGISGKREEKHHGSCWEGVGGK